MSRDILKTFSFLSVHLIVGFSVAYGLTGSIVVAGGIALIEPCVNAVAFYFHERAWNPEVKLLSMRQSADYGTHSCLTA